MNATLTPKKLGKYENMKSKNVVFSCRMNPKSINTKESVLFEKLQNRLNQRILVTTVIIIIITSNSRQLITKSKSFETTCGSRNRKKEFLLFDSH